MVCRGRTCNRISNKPGEGHPWKVPTPCWSAAACSIHAVRASTNWHHKGNSQSQSVLERAHWRGSNRIGETHLDPSIRYFVDSGATAESPTIRELTVLQMTTLMTVNRFIAFFLLLSMGGTVCVADVCMYKPPKRVMLPVRLLTPPVALFWLPCDWSHRARPAHFPIVISSNNEPPCWLKTHPNKGRVFDIGPCYDSSGRFRTRTVSGRKESECSAQLGTQAISQASLPAVETTALMFS